MTMVRLNRFKGFSLIEVLIALILLGGGLLALARLQMGMLGGAAESVLNDHAVRLAEDKLESLRFDLASGQNPSAGHDTMVVDGVTLERSWQGSMDDKGLVHWEINLRWQAPANAEVTMLNLPAVMIRPDLDAQAWLIQVGQPSREPLP
jgi:prepilin-type N-terminal cleavage/methylation domain-containing protein